MRVRESMCMCKRGRERGEKAGRQINRQVGKQAGKQAGKQSNKHTHRLTLKDGSSGEYEWQHLIFLIDDIRP